MKNPFRKNQTPAATADSPATVNAWDSSDVVEQQQQQQQNTNPFAISTSNAAAGEKTEYNPSPTSTPVAVDDPSNKSPDPLTGGHPQQSPSPVMHTRSASIDIPPPAAEEPITEKPRKKPNKGRLVVRVWQLVAAIGAFGFQVGATPYSGHQIPYSSVGLLYYVYAICWFSFLWSLFNIYVYMTRRFGRAGKIKRAVSILLDCFCAALFGVGTFYEFAMYRCPPGYYDGWCNFFNTGLFFCVSLFLTYVIQTLWDIFGGMSCLRRK